METVLWSEFDFIYSIGALDGNQNNKNVGSFRSEKNPNRMTMKRFCRIKWKIIWRRP